MKKIIFGIFAHPDDEAFGPAGALLKATKESAELHLLCLTNGEAGENPDDIANLGEARLQEWREAGRLLGAATMQAFGMGDGQLSNTTMREAAERIEEYVHGVVRSCTDPTEVDFITLDLNGITGHIDHIVATRAACLAFYRLKEQDDCYKRILLATWPRSAFPTVTTDWVFMEPGCSPEEIDETIDARQYRDEITQIARVHHSQRADGERFLAWQGDALGLCHFKIMR